MELLIRKLGENAKIPTRATPGSAGCDLYASQDVIIPPHKQLPISTEIALEIPKGYYGKIEPRSGFARDYAIDVLAGVIDSDYRGQVIIILINHSDMPFKVDRHMRIAQLLIIPCAILPIQLVEKLDNTTRGTDGFGSTGTK